MSDKPTTNVQTIRVRYTEVDAMGYLHHSRYLQYFELGRTELLRDRGIAYADLEKAGTLVVVIEASVKYKQPARYDDLVELTTTVAKVTPVRIYHDYVLRRGETLLASGQTCVVCTDASGSPVRLPEMMQ